MAYLNGKKILFGAPVTVVNGYKDGQLALLENSKYMNANVKGTAVAINDCSPVEHDLKVKVEVLDTAACNLLTAPYSVNYSSGYGVTVTENATSISVSGTFEESYNGFGIAINQFTELAKTLTHGAKYCCGLKYINGNPNEQPIQLHFMCGGQSGVFNVNDIVWDSTFTDCYLVMFFKNGVNYDGCEIVPILTTSPPIDLSTVKVSRYGKNLFDKDNISSIKAFISGNTTVASGACKCAYIKCLPNTTYTVSKMASKRFAIGCTDTVPIIASTKINNINFNYTAEALTITTDSTAQYLLIWYYHSSYDTEITPEELEETLQVEIGDTATPYEPYIEPVEYDVTEYGTVVGIKGLHPNMTLIPDTENIIINCQYLRDIDTYIDNLMMNVALTGGE